MKTYQDILLELTSKIKQKGMEESAAKLIMQDVLDKTGSDFFLILSENIDETKVQKIMEITDKYLSYVPLQYILGYTYFYNLKFKVNKDVLIPRFDTENLVELVLKKYKNVDSLVDVGTGSGNIAISLKYNMINTKVYAVDLSNEALNVAKDNAKLNNVEIEFMSGDLLKPLINKGIKVPLIVSNPPYIAIDDKEVSSIVKDNEPNMALFARKNGLEVYERLFEQAKDVLDKKGVIIVEIGYRQALDVTKLAYKYFGKNILVEVHPDINGLDRVLEIILAN